MNYVPPSVAVAAAPLHLFSRVECDAVASIVHATTQR
jgi:hypothetical protein